jgi:hypothetical protein
VTTTAYAGGLSRTLVDASAGQHRSGPLVTAVPELLHTEEVTGRWSTLRLNDLESLPLVCYAPGADVTGYPRHPVTPALMPIFWSHPGAKARRRRLCLVGSLGTLQGCPGTGLDLRPAVATGDPS